MRLTADTSSLDESPSAGIPLVPGHSFLQTPLVRSVSEGESSFRSDCPIHSFARPPKVPPLPDPSQFPDPYPQRSPYSRMSDRLSSTLPALSSEGSSSASTRSSAYTSSGSALTSSDLWPYSRRYRRGRGDWPRSGNHIPRRGPDLAHQDCSSFVRRKNSNRPDQMVRILSEYSIEVIFHRAK